MNSWEKRLHNQTISRGVNSVPVKIETWKLPLPLHSQYDPQTSSTCVLARNAESLSLLKTHQLRICVLSRFIRWFICRLIFEKHWSRIIQTGNHFAIVTVLNSPHRERALLCNTGSIWFLRSTQLSALTSSLNSSRELSMSICLHPSSWRLPWQNIYKENIVWGQSVLQKQRIVGAWKEIKETSLRSS